MSFILRSARKVGSLFLFQCIFSVILTKLIPWQKLHRSRKEHHAGNPVYFRSGRNTDENDQTISAFTAEAINMLVKQGLHFSYATARSILTASKITENITAGIPVIVYNGSFIQDSNSREILYSRFFDKTSAELILRQLLSSGVYPIVYSHTGGCERFSYYRDRQNSGISAFLSEEGMM